MLAVPHADLLGGGEPAGHTRYVRCDPAKSANAHVPHATPMHKPHSPPAANVRKQCRPKSLYFLGPPALHRVSCLAIDPTRYRNSQEAFILPETPDLGTYLGMHNAGAATPAPTSQWSEFEAPSLPTKHEYMKSTLPCGSRIRVSVSADPRTPASLTSSCSDCS